MSAKPHAATAAVVVMGVAASGKTTVGKRLASRLGWTFRDADDYHPLGNVEKMRRGEALTDADRVPWLETLQDVLVGALTSGRPVVLACSALKRGYRDVLRIDEGVRFVFLDADRSTIEERMRTRKGHFAGRRLIDSQFAALEDPEDADVAIDASLPPDVIVSNVSRRLGLDGRGT